MGHKSIILDIHLNSVWHLFQLRHLGGQLLHGASSFLGTSVPYDLCTFSRIYEYKALELAIANGVCNLISDMD